MHHYFLPIHRGDNYMSHFHGHWGNEHTMDEEKLTNGQRLISKQRRSNNTETDNPSFMVTMDGKPQRNTDKSIRR